MSRRGTGRPYNAAGEADDLEAVGGGEVKEGVEEVLVGGGEAVKGLEDEDELLRRLRLEPGRDRG